MNPLLQTITASQASMGNIMSIVKMLQGKDPNAVMNMLAQRNPQFRQFAEKCKGKTPEQVAQEYGVDITALKQMLR